MAENDPSSEILACPNCGTRYRAPGPVLGRPDATYRCARCQHVFSLGPTDDIPKPSGFDFDLDEEPTVADELSPRAPAGSDIPVFVGTSLEPDDADPEFAPEPAFTTSSPGGRQPGASEMASRGPLSGLQMGVRFEALVLVAFGAAALYFVAYPRTVLEVARRLPFLQTTLGTSPDLLERVYLADVQGVHERLRGNRPAFVIAGRVVNHSGAPIGAVQVEGRLYDGTKEIGRKAVFAGVKASQRLVKEWTRAEIETFERIAPPNSYRLAPGASADFLIIFQDPPQNIREFGCGLIAARPVKGP